MSDDTRSPELTLEEVAERLRTDSYAWIKQGVRDGRFPCLHVPTRNGRPAMRFTEEHYRQIVAALEQRANDTADDERTAPAKRRPSANAPAAEVFGATSRSVNRHRKPKGGVA